ncbi:DinB family protein [Chitinivorax sp. PXF-14]|uniref:DinB family protein n=1 Tax=Chitinivorax sp. PXF-14 TaxID=3230488 RepID=UPI003465987C
MFAGNYPQLMAEYNRWMNEKLYAACAQLDDTVRKADRSAFFGSIHNTLDHLLWGDGVWLTRFDGNTYPSGPFGQPLYEDFEQLQRARAEMDQAIIAWARQVDQAWLDQPMTWSSKLYGFTQTHPRWVQVVQMFNHQTHHRGQITTLLNQLGIDVGITDVPMLPILNDMPGAQA